MYSNKKCVPCESGGNRMAASDAGKAISDIPGWEMDDNATWIWRRLEFKDFAGAIEFANQVGTLCEEQGHHADMCLGWGYCTVKFQTHSLDGLHENDFIMAAKINEMLKKSK